MNRQTINEAAKAFTITVLAILGAHLYAGAWITWAIYPQIAAKTAEPRERLDMVVFALATWPRALRNLHDGEG